MNKRSIKTVFSIAIAAMALLVISAVTANAATCSVSDTAPVVDEHDIANLIPTTSTDKWWAENSAAGDPKGQTFTTPSQPVVLNAITFEIGDNNKAESTKNYTIRVSTINKVDPANSSTWVLQPVYSEEATQDMQWIGPVKAAELGVDPNPFMTWTFDTPVELAADTEYAIDIGMTSSSVGWQSGIPYVKRTGNEYAGGTRYSADRIGVGIGGTSISNVSGDRVFHLDIGASSVDPELPTVEAGSNWVTWSGAPVALDDAFVINNSVSNLIINWSADSSGVAVDFSATDVEAPTITITKDPGDPVTVTFTVAANYEGSTSDDVVDTMTIDVYDTACLAAGAFGEVVLDATDINQDCVTDIQDLYELAAKWLVSYQLDAPAVK